LKDKKDKPITGTEQIQIDALAQYFSNYPIHFFGRNAIESKLCSDYGYNPIRDKIRLTLLGNEVIRERMVSLAKQNPGYQSFPIINLKSGTEAEAEDRVIGGGS
jgi:hypothetical protein